MSATRDATHEAVPVNTETTLAILAVEMRYVRAAVDEIKDNQKSTLSRPDWENRNTHVDQMLAQTVPRTEWEQRNAYVDQRFAEVDRRRVSWPAVGALLVAVAVLALDVVGRLIPN